jgi:peptidyl-prolyl cis-trans isomerase SurA
MNMKRLIVILGCTVLPLTNFAQENNSKILMTFADQKVTLEEFENIFKKNSSKDQVIDKKSLDEYIDLFINFKLKVYEAKKMKLDTSASYISEYNGYKKQLSTPYLKDKNAEDAMVKEAYDRMKKDLKVSHILLKSSKDCMLPEDTLALWKKAMDIKKRLVKEKFEDVAKSVSEDDYSKAVGGDLGWFTSLMWAYPFETAAYNMKIGEISNPIRTSYGYHIIKLNDTRPSRGEVKVAHIFVNAPEKDEAAQKPGMDKIFEAYDQLLKGTPFGEVVNNYSDDKASAQNGGELPKFGIGKMVVEFEDQAFELQNPGDFSKPFKTKYGFHIVKLIEKIPLRPFEQYKDELFKLVQRNPRYKLLNDYFVEGVKKEYGFTEFKSALDKLKALEDPKTKTIRYTAVDSVINEPLFKIGKTTYSLDDFKDYFRTRVQKSNELNYCNLIEKFVIPFQASKCMAYAEENLDQKYPEYKNLLAEYRDGILLFDLMDKKVWSKSVEDTAGLRAYFNSHRNNYMWKERVDAYKFTATDMATAQKAHKDAQNLLSGKLTTDGLLAKYNKKVSVLALTHEMFEKGENAKLDSLGWEPKISEIFQGNENINFYYIKGKKSPEPKELKDSKGNVISDYQTYLEQNWISELRSKYPVQLDKSILYSLITK